MESPLAALNSLTSSMQPSGIPSGTAMAATPISSETTSQLLENTPQTMTDSSVKLPSSISPHVGSAVTNKTNSNVDGGAVVDNGTPSVNNSNSSNSLHNSSSTVPSEDSALSNNIGNSGNKRCIKDGEVLNSGSLAEIHKCYWQE